MHPIMYSLLKEHQFIFPAACAMRRRPKPPFRTLNGSSPERRGFLAAIARIDVDLLFAFPVGLFLV